jgi:hypothetical protein
MQGLLNLKAAVEREKAVQAIDPKSGSWHLPGVRNSLYGSGHENFSSL